MWEYLRRTTHQDVDCTHDFVGDVRRLFK